MSKMHNKYTDIYTIYCHPVHHWPGPDTAHSPTTPGNHHHQVMQTVTIPSSVYVLQHLVDGMLWLLLVRPVIRHVETHVHHSKTCQRIIQYSILGLAVLILIPNMCIMFKVVS